MSQSGSAEALDELVRRCSPRVRKFAYHLCPVSEALDAAQETLLIVSQKIRSLKVTRAFVSWLFQIVRRQCQRSFATIKTNINISKTMIELHEDEKYPSAHEVLVMKEIWTVFRKINSEDQGLIIEKDIEDKTLEEMAQKRDLSMPALKTRLHRARKNLRSLVNRELCDLHL